MGNLTQAFGKDGVCAICKRRPVNRWCDYVISYETTTTFFRDYKDFVSANRQNDYETCDLPMCETCATNGGRDRDLCPHHMGLHRTVKLPDEYQRRRQSQTKSEMYRDIF